MPMQRRMNLAAIGPLAVLTGSALAFGPGCGHTGCAAHGPAAGPANADLPARLIGLNALSERFRQAHRCYPVDITPLELEQMTAQYLLMPPGMFIGGVAPDFATDDTVWTGNGAQGESGRALRASLTYSFPADGVVWDISPAARTSNLAAKLALLSPGGTDPEFGRELLRSAAAAWRKRAGIDFSEVPDANLPLDTDPARRSTFGDIRWGGVDLQSGSPLAFNYFPTGGSDLTVNTNLANFSPARFLNPDNRYRYFRNTMAHELGHGLGYFHQVPCDGTKLMEPFVNTSFDMLQIDEKRGSQRNYGDRFAGNHTRQTARNLGSLTSPQVRSVLEPWLSTNGQFNAVTNPTGNDWFRFSIDSPRAVTIRVSPAGGSLFTGPQDAGCSGQPVDVNALAAGNLAVEVYRASQPANPIGTAASAPAGQPEVVSLGTLARGDYLIRVTDVGPNSTVNQVVQLYTLGVEVDATPARPIAIAGVSKRARIGSPSWFIGDVNSEAVDPGIPGPTPQDPPVRPAAALTSFAWDFNADGLFETQGPQVSKVFNFNGVYPVTLRVTDSNQSIGFDTISVEVFGAPCVFADVSPRGGRQGALVPITLLGSQLGGVTVDELRVSPPDDITVTGAAIRNADGSVIQGIVLLIGPNAAPGPRTLSVADNIGGAAVLPRPFFIESAASNCPPQITEQPASASLTIGADASFTVTASGEGNLTFRWLRNNIALNNGGRISGADTPTLTINDIDTSDDGVYAVLISASGCEADALSDLVTLTVTGGAEPCSVADVAGIGGPGSLPDGLLTGDDFVVFINSFATGDAVADIVSIGGNPPGDGLITGDDFNAFIAAFAAGCP